MPHLINPLTLYCRDKDLYNDYVLTVEEDSHIVFVVSLNQPFLFLHNESINVTFRSEI